MGTATSAVVEIAVIWHRSYAARLPSTAEAMAKRPTGYLRPKPPPSVPAKERIPSGGMMRGIYLGIETFRTDLAAAAMPAGLVVKLLDDAGLLVPEGEQRSYQYRLPRCIDPERVRVNRRDRQRIAAG